MASRRDLKKDVNFLTSQLIGECSLGYTFQPEKKELFAEIISQSIIKRAELLNKICNTPSKMEKKMVKAYYNEITKEMLEFIITYLNKINTEN